eukprot:415829_1
MGCMQGRTVSNMDTKEEDMLLVFGFCHQFTMKYSLDEIVKIILHIYNTMKVPDTFNLDLCGKYITVNQARYIATHHKEQNVRNTVYGTKIIEPPYEKTMEFEWKIQITEKETSGLYIGIDHVDGRAIDQLFVDQGRVKAWYGYHAHSGYVIEWNGTAFGFKSCPKMKQNDVLTMTLIFKEDNRKYGSLCYKINNGETFTPFEYVDNSILYRLAITMSSPNTQVELL